MYIVSVLSLLWFATLCDGHCVWYGQCGNNTEIAKDKKLNCKYNGPPKSFSTQMGVDKFKEICPSLYTGPDVRTCCSDDQVLTLNDQLSIPRQTIQRCPSCYHNFMNIWCYLTCGPNQAEYMSVNATRPYIDPYNVTTEAVVSVEYVVGVDSADGMFNSCRNVQIPRSNEPALSLLCGYDVDMCTPQKWLDYMGTIQNGQAPFDINFHISNNNMTFNGTVRKPLYMNPVPCYKAVDNTTRPCSCQDCPSNDTESTLPCQYVVVPDNCDDLLNRPKISSDGSSFRLEQVIVSRPNNHTIIPYKSRNYSNIFDLTFLHKILDLQLSIANISAVSRNKTVGLQDFCLAPQSPNNTNCTVLSVLNYYQNSHEMLDKVVYDRFGWFVLGNYLDHFEMCTIYPCLESDFILKTSCIGTFGGPIEPWEALYGYQNYNYRSATALIINFLVHDHKDSIRKHQVKAWEKEFLAFMKNYKNSHTDIGISYSSKRASDGMIHTGLKLLESETGPWQKTLNSMRPTGSKPFKSILTGKRSKNRAIEKFIIQH